MQIEIPCIGDTHANNGPRNASVFRVLDSIIAENEGRPGLAAWAWPGDLNHEAMSIPNRNALAERAERMATSAPVIICDGNHDIPGDLAIFGRIRAKHRIYVVSSAQVLRLELATGHIASIFVLPYPHVGGLVAAGTPPADLHAAAHGKLDAIFMDAGHALEEARQRGELTLFMMHGTVDGSIASTGQPQFGGTEIAIDAVHLSRLPDCPKVANHIHRGQTISGVVVPGSICRLDYGEIEPKRYVRLEYSSPSDWRFEECPIDIPPLFYVEGTFIGGVLEYRFTAGPAGPLQERPESVKGAEVRARISFPQSERAFWEMGKAQLFADFADAKLFIDPRAVPDRALRAPEVARARTKREKVIAWGSLGQVVVNDLTLSNLDRLEELDPDRFLTHIDETIAEVVTGKSKAEDYDPFVYPLDDSGQLRHIAPAPPSLAFDEVEGVQR